MSEEERFRGYNLPIHTLKKLDWLHLISDISKPQLVSNAIDLLYIAYSIFPKDLKKKTIEDLLNDPNDAILNEIKLHLQKHIHDEDQEVRW